MILLHRILRLPYLWMLLLKDWMTMAFCTNNSSSLKSSPEMLLDSLEKLLYVKKGFQRSNMKSQLEPRVLYLQLFCCYVCTCMLGNRENALVMEPFIFDCEIFFPHDNHGLPRGYLSQAENKESDHQNEMT